MGVFAFIGFALGALKIPTIVGIPITKKIGGEPIGEIILRYIKFKKKIYYAYKKSFSYYHQISLFIHNSNLYILNTLH